MPAYRMHSLNVAGEAPAPARPIHFQTRIRLTLHRLSAMTLRLTATTLTLALALLLPLSGCDETGNATTDVAASISDARIASQSGDYARAIEILEAVLAANPGNAPATGELAATLLARNDLDILDLDRIAQFVVDGTGGGTAQPAPAAGRGGTCAYTTDPTATPFDPTDVPGFAGIDSSRADIERAIALIAPLLPATLTTFDTCTAISPEGELTYDLAATTAQLRATGMTDAQLSQLLTTNALVRFLSAYIYVSDNLDQETQWFRLPGGRIAICVDDEEALRDQAEPAVETLGTAVLSLDTRARSFGGDASIVQLGLDAFDDISEAFFEFCAAQRAA